MLVESYKLVGVKEIAEEFFVSRALVSRWTSGYYRNFPEPLAVIGQSKIWDIEQIRQWYSLPRKDK